jgi:hypothetical protein
MANGEMHGVFIDFDLGGRARSFMIYFRGVMIGYRYAPQ